MENVMKVKVNCTLEIDKKIIETYIDDMGDQESIKEIRKQFAPAPAA